MSDCQFEYIVYPSGTISTMYVECSICGQRGVENNGDLRASLPYKDSDSLYACEEFQILMMMES